MLTSSLFSRAAPFSQIWRSLYTKLYSSVHWLFDVTGICQLRLPIYGTWQPPFCYRPCFFVCSRNATCAFRGEYRDLNGVVEFIETVVPYPPYKSYYQDLRSPKRRSWPLVPCRAWGCHFRSTRVEAQQQDLRGSLGIYTR